MEDHSSATASSLVLGCVTAQGVRVLLARARSGVSPWTFETRRRPLAPPVYCMYVVYGWGGPQGSWALWALTFYNPNSVYHYRSDDTWRDHVVSGDRWVIGVDPKVPELSRIALRTTHVSQAGANTRPELTTIPARY